MNRNEVATFFKVSEERYAQDVCGMTAAEAKEAVDMHKCFGRAQTYYDNIRLPSRATVGSAGYDFYLPEPVVIGTTPVLVYTGVRVRLDDGWMLAIFPRSGLGFKYGVRLVNTTGIIDSDYFNADNEGHIALKLVASTPVELKAGDRFAQGIIMPYGIATNDKILMGHRAGGFGSTGGTD